MKMPSWSNASAALLALALVAACGTAGGGTAPSATPGAPGTSAPAAAGTGRYTQADVRFIQNMIPHHAQALEMAALVPERTTNESIRLMAERIVVSQQDEIATMQRWLEKHGLPPVDPAAHAQHHAAGHHASMPGMLTPQEMQRLAAARGAEFDRLFLELMIRHHEGALTMVDELFASPGAAQGGEIYQIASEIASDQRMEIDRMRSMLAR